MIKSLTPQTDRYGLGRTVPAAGAQCAHYIALAGVGLPVADFMLIQVNHRVPTGRRC